MVCQFFSFVSARNCFCFGYYGRSVVAGQDSRQVQAGPDINKVLNPSLLSTPSIRNPSPESAARSQPSGDLHNDNYTDTLIIGIKPGACGKNTFTRRRVCARARVSMSSRETGAALRFTVIEWPWHCTVWHWQWFYRWTDRSTRRTLISDI